MVNIADVLKINRNWRANNSEQNLARVNFYDLNVFPELSYQFGKRNKADEISLMNQAKRKSALSVNSSNLDGERMRIKISPVNDLAFRRVAERHFLPKLTASKLK